MFIGEAPGPSEDILGKPFVGPAGNILEQILQEVFNNLLDDRAGQPEFTMPTYCFTNVVCCFPEITVSDIEAGREKPDAKLGIRDPRKVEADACRPRLDEFIGLVKPRLIIRLGKVAVKHTAYLVGKYPVLNMIHPGALVYMDDNPAMQRLEFDKCVARLTKWLGTL